MKADKTACGVCLFAFVLQRSLWTYGVLSNCTADNVCPQVDVNSRQYTVLNSSNAAVAQIMAGTSFHSKWRRDQIHALPTHCPASDAQHIHNMHSMRMGWTSNLSASLALTGFAPGCILAHLLLASILHSCPNQSTLHLLPSGSLVTPQLCVQLLPLLSHAGYPLLDNILVPTAAGNSRISSTFSRVASRSFTLTVKDTYRSTWPSAMPLSDTSARVDANMSDAQLLVTYLLVPSTQLDLLASPPVMPSLRAVQAGATHCQSCSCLLSCMHGSCLTRGETYWGARL
jgi:hypothetical protein